jgi:hypothetical protein
MTQTLAKNAPARLYGSVFKGVLVSALLAMSAAGAAQAAVITFDTQSGTVVNDQAFDANGYQVRFFAPGDVTPGTVPIGQYANGSTCGGGSSCPTNDASTFLDLYSNGYVDIVPASDSGTFSFTSLDASFFGATDVSYPNFAGAIQVRGYNQGQLEAIDQFNLPAPDGNGNVSLQTFLADNLAGQQFSEIAIFGLTCDTNGDCIGLDGGSGQYALDNIVLSDQPSNNVPEPATAALLGAGMLGFGARRRKRA